MKLNGRAVLLWHALCTSWLALQAGCLEKDEQRSRPTSNVKNRIYKPSHHFLSKKFKESLHRPLTARGLREKNDKRSFIRRKIQIKGAPKGVIVTLNGQRIDTNSGGTTSPVQPQPAPSPVANHPINLHINLNRKHFEGNIVGQRKQPIIIARPNPPRPIVIPIPMPAQPQPPQPVILPAPLPPPIPPAPVLPAPVPPPLPIPIPVPAPAPPPDKEDSDLASILQTAALLNTLGKKEESRPKIIPVMQPFIPPMAYQPPNMGYPPGGNPNQGYQGYPAGGNPNQGYPAGGGYNQGYPAGGNENQGYPAGGNPHQGYPAGGNENQGYPAGGSPHQGYPAGGNQNQGYPAGGNQNQGYPAGGNQNGAAAPATNTGSPLTGLNGILPLLIPFNCRCGCERRCPDLCNLCRGGVDEEIIDTLECCRTQPCTCLNTGTGTTQPPAVGAGVSPIGAPGLPVAPQPQQGPALPVPASTPAQPQPIQQSYPSLLPSQPVAVPPLPPLGQANQVSPLQPASAPPLPSQPASAPPLGAPPQPLPSGPGPPVSAPGRPPPLPPKPEITPPAAEITPPKPGSVPPKPEIPVPGPPGSLIPPKPEIPIPGAPGSGVPLKPETPGQGPVPETGTKVPPKPEIEGPEAGPGKEPSTSGPGPPGSLVAPPPDNTGPIQLPSLPPLLPGESAARAPAAPNPVGSHPAAPTPTVEPPLPQLPLPKTAYPAPPPPPQVFIIKENSASAKDPEDSKSAEALDNLSQSFENAFTKALKSQRKKTQLHHKPRRGSVDQKPEERDNLDLEEEANENDENEDDEEKVQFYGGSRGDLEDDDINKESDISQENDNDDDNDNEDDNADKADNDDDDYDEDDNDNNQIKADEEPPYDLNQPRYSHSRPFNEDEEHQDSSRRDYEEKSRKRKKYLGLKQNGQNEDYRAKKADRYRLSHGRPKNTFRNRYVELQGFRSHTYKEKHPTLKTMNYDDMSRGFDFDSINDERAQKVHRERHHPTLKTTNYEFDSDPIYGVTTRKVPSEAVSVSSRRHQVRSKHFNSQKPRSKFKVHRKKHPTLKATNPDDRSRGYDIDSIYDESTQRVPLETPPVTGRRHKVRSKHFSSQKPRSKLQHYSKDLSVSHDTSNFAHLQDRASHKHGRKHGRDHHTRHKLSKEVIKSHSTTEMIPEDEITEGVGSTSGDNDSSGDGERLVSTESLSSAGNNENSNQHLPVEDSYIEGHKNPALTTVQSFKPERHPKFSKRKKIKSVKNMKEEDSYSSGEESGEKEDTSP